MSDGAETVNKQNFYLIWFLFHTCLFVTSFSKINRGHGNQKPLLQDKTGYTEKRWERLRPRQQGNGWIFDLLTHLTGHFVHTEPFDLFALSDTRSFTGRRLRGSEWGYLDNTKHFIFWVYQGVFGHFTTIPDCFRRFATATDDSRRLSKIFQDSRRGPTITEDVRRTLQTLNGIFFGTANIKKLANLIANTKHYRQITLNTNSHLRPSSTCLYGYGGSAWTEHLNLRSFSGLLKIRTMSCERSFSLLSLFYHITLLGWGGGGGGWWVGGTAIYGLCRYVPLWRVLFSSSLLWDGIYKSASLGLELGIIFQETDQLVEDFSLD